MTTTRVREALRLALRLLRFVAGALFCMLGWLIVLFTSTPRTRRSPPDLTDAAQPDALNSIDGEPLPHPFDFPPAWRVTTGGPSDHVSSSIPVHLAPYVERVDDLDA